MKRFFLFIFVIFSFNQSNTFNNLPHCKNCLYFRRSINKIDYSIQYECHKEKIVGKISNITKHETTLLTRLDENKCGINGKWYIKKPNNTIINKKKILFNILLFIFIIQAIYH